MRREEGIPFSLFFVNFFYSSFLLLVGFLVVLP